VVSTRIRPAAALATIRRHAREKGFAVRELPRRGKGSHRIFVVVDSSGAELARFGLTGHRRELSWKVLTELEKALAPSFGEGWMEKR
jgi:hypothetical protein